MQLQQSVSKAAPGAKRVVRESVLQVKNVTKTFGDAIAVNDVSFEVYDGEFLFLIGPSGCGKTTHSG